MATQTGPYPRYEPAPGSSAHAQWSRLSDDLKRACDAWIADAPNDPVLKAALDDDRVRPALMRALGY